MPIQVILLAKAPQLDGAFTNHRFMLREIELLTKGVAHVCCEELLHSILSEIGVTELSVEVWTMSYDFLAVNRWVSEHILLSYLYPLEHSTQKCVNSTKCCEYFFQINHDKELILRYSAQVH